MLRPLALALLLLPAMSFAQAPAEPLSRCLADNTTGKDRKELARWVFLSMAAHPEIRQYTAPSATVAAGEAHKSMAQIFTRLLADACKQEAQDAFKQGGSKSIQAAFQTLGQLAMQELMSDPDVGQSMSAFEKHLDQKKLSEAINGQ
ncbi:hypothetical protein [Pseudorhodoferax sp.]|uniref:hypothetical protein n=1 Tax=Pseudorhodoferax sp. TaxID=1993553 RepID=UPI002DD653D4|nr:hypothetical protein [Pseudorhodoferax sp.]